MMKSSAGLIVICNKISDLISFISFILWCIFYSCILTIQDLYSFFRPLFKFLYRILPKRSHVPMPSRPAQPACQVHIRDVEIVMEKLGLCHGPLDSSLLDVESVFGEESEPNLGEVKEAFEVFDENKDGFIDAGELNKVMESLGLVGFSQEQVEKMIMSFDEDGDGRIDFGEFVKLLEGGC